MSDSKTGIMVSLQGLVKHYGDVPALDGVDLQVREGEVVSIIGPSGSGKSTLLRSINQLERVDQGCIEIEGEMVVGGPGTKRDRSSADRIRKANMKLGMVFQHFNLFPHKTVLENIMEAPLVVKKVDKQELKKRALLLLEQVGLGDKKDAYPDRISGGQKQRVAIARALGMEPDILLCDEPTSALDPELVGEVLSVLRDLASRNMTMLVVTHEMAFAREISDRIIFMDRGKILADEAPDHFFTRQQHPRIQEFLGKMI